MFQNALLKNQVLWSKNWIDSDAHHYETSSFDKIRNCLLFLPAIHPTDDSWWEYTKNFKTKYKNQTF